MGWRRYIQDRSVPARIVRTTLKSPARSAKSRIKTAALRVKGSSSHVVGGGWYARRRAIAC
jgi:hypothetical protein